MRDTDIVKARGSGGEWDLGIGPGKLGLGTVATTLKSWE